jgi:hypothetical protein
MKKLLLTLFFFLLSSQSFGKVGDVYFCSMTQHHKVTESQVEEMELYKFNMGSGIDESKYNTPFLTFSWGDMSVPYYISRVKHKPEDNYTGSSYGFTVQFQDGNFYFSAIHKKFIRLVIAECEIF